MFCRFNVDGLLRGNYQSRMQGYSIGIANGFMSVNDVRALEQMDLIPDEEGGNTYMVNGTMTPLRNIGAAYGLDGQEKQDQEDHDEEKGGEEDGSNEYNRSKIWKAHSTPKSG